MAEFSGGGGGGGAVAGGVYNGQFPATPVWTPNTNYVENQLVRYNQTDNDTKSGGTYQRITAGTSGATFDPGNWRVIALDVPGPPGPTPAPAAYLKPYRRLASYGSFTDTAGQTTTVGSPQADILLTHDFDTSYVRVQAVANDIDMTHAGFVVNFAPLVPTDPAAELVRVDVVAICRTENGTFPPGDAARAWDNGNGDPAGAQLFEIATLTANGAVAYSTTAHTFTDNVYHERTKPLVLNDNAGAAGAPPTQIELAAGLRIRIRRIQSIGVTDRHMRFTHMRYVAYYNHSVTS